VSNCRRFCIRGRGTDRSGGGCVSTVCRPGTALEV